MVAVQGRKILEISHGKGAANEIMYLSREQLQELNFTGIREQCWFTILRQFQFNQAQLTDSM